MFIFNNLLIILSFILTKQLLLGMFTSIHIIIVIIVFCVILVFVLYKTFGIKKTSQTTTAFLSKNLFLQSSVLVFVFIFYFLQVYWNLKLDQNLFDLIKNNGSGGYKNSNVSFSDYNYKLLLTANYSSYNDTVESITFLIFFFLI